MVSRTKIGAMRRILATSSVVLAMIPSLGLAEGAPIFALELNKTEDTAGGCRTTFVARNGTGTDLEKASFEVVVFDKTDVVSQYLVLDFGKLIAGKTGSSSSNSGRHQMRRHLAPARERRRGVPDGRRAGVGLP